MPSNLRPTLAEAVSKLKSLHEGEVGVLDVISCGKPAVPALRALLFEREPSGLFQSRCRAVQALAKLDAFDVLMEYLSPEPSSNDPVEQLGNDAVVNAVAQALGKRRYEPAVPLLLQLARKPCLTGVIRALGEFECAESIPLLINALEEDASRRPAMAALKRMRRNARPALIASANLRSPSWAQESESSRRRRRSALQFLGEIGLPRQEWPRLRGLLRDEDASVSVLACKLCLDRGRSFEKPDAIHRLIELFPDAGWQLRDDIEGALLNHAQLVKNME